MREVEVFFAREQDRWYEELLTHVQHSTLTPSQAIATITPAPARPAGAPAASSFSGSWTVTSHHTCPHGTPAALQPPMSVPTGSPLGEGVYLAPTPFAVSVNPLLHEHQLIGWLGASGSLSRNLMKGFSAGCCSIDPPTHFTTWIQSPSPISVPTHAGASVHPLLQGTATRGSM
eukprot:3017855-Amphidinium_carterae.1